ncbi:MAG: iron-sulfur cluster assembly accessory protein [Chloroflexi bacterium]|nr:iron-sulfur cluster assembly accessory protein [Chloroflexota bacterium]MCZ6866132.1 iron-sulfur cluster assembly accessory protein [Chloroflexota bacterium]
MVSTTEQKSIGIQVTDKARKAVRRIAVREGHPDDDFGLRVGVKGGGCSGLLYVLSIEKNEPVETDRIVDDNGLRIFIDKKSYIYLAGTELDFSDGLNGKGFVFQNPNAKKACGCGNSFGV